MRAGMPPVKTLLSIVSRLLGVIGCLADLA